MKFVLKNKVDIKSTRISNEEIEQSDVVIIAKMVSISGKDDLKENFRS